MFASTRARGVESHHKQQRTIAKVGTHAKPMKPPKHYHPQMTLTDTARPSLLEALRADSRPQQGSPMELKRRQAISQLGTVPTEYVIWRFERVRIQKSPCIDRMKEPLSTRIYTPDEPTTNEALWGGPVGRRVIAEERHHQRDKEDASWAQAEPEWVERLALLSGFSSVA